MPSFDIAGRRSYQGDVLSLPLPYVRCLLSRSRMCLGRHCRGHQVHVSQVGVTRSRWGAWPRDAAVTRTGKQAGKALRSQGHHYARVMRQSVSGSLPL